MVVVGKKGEAVFHRLIVLSHNVFVVVDGGM